MPALKLHKTGSDTFRVLVDGNVSPYLVGFREPNEAVVCAKERFLAEHPTASIDIDGASVYLMDAVDCLRLLSQKHDEQLSWSGAEYISQAEETVMELYGGAHHTPPAFKNAIRFSVRAFMLKTLGEYPERLNKWLLAAERYGVGEDPEVLRGELGIGLLFPLMEDKHFGRLFPITCVAYFVSNEWARNPVNSELRELASYALGRAFTENDDLREVQQCLDSGVFRSKEIGHIWDGYSNRNSIEDDETRLQVSDDWHQLRDELGPDIFVLPAVR